MKAAASAAAARTVILKRDVMSERKKSSGLRPVARLRTVRVYGLDHGTTGPRLPAWGDRIRHRKKKDLNRRIDPGLAGLTGQAPAGAKSSGVHTQWTAPFLPYQLSS